MKHGMRRKCDDERRNFCLAVLAVAVAAVSAAGYLWWQASRPSEWRRAEGKALSGRAERLLADTGSMAADLEGMSRGPEAEDKEKVDFYQKVCAAERRKEAARQAEAWTAADGVERDRGSEVREGLGNGAVDDLRHEWEHQLERVRQAKERLDGAVQGTWVWEGRFEEAKKALEEAIAEPERLWALREEWAAAREARETAYKALYELPMSDRVVEETRESLERFAQEASRTVASARQRWAEGNAARKQAIADGILEVDRLWDELAALHEANSSQVATPVASGLPKAKEALLGLETRQGEAEVAQSGILDAQDRALDRVLGAVRGQLSILYGKDIRSDGIAKICQDALGSTNGFGHIAAALDKVLEEASSARSEAENVGKKQVAEAKRILSDEKKKAPTATTLDHRMKALNTERAVLREDLRALRADAEETWNQTEEREWLHEFGKEREARRREVEEAIARAEKGFPTDLKSLANGNALADAERANAERKNLADDAKRMQTAWKKRVEDASALEGALATCAETGRTLQYMETRRNGGSESVEKLAKALAELVPQLEARLGEVWGNPVGTGAVAAAAKDAGKASELAERVAIAERNGWIGAIEYVDRAVPGVVGWGPGSRTTERVFKKQELEALRGSDLPGADSGSRGPFGMKFSLVLPDDLPHRVVVGFGKDSGVRLKGANTARGSSRNLRLSTRLRVVGGGAGEETGDVEVPDTTALIQANKKPVASVSVQGRMGQRVDFEFEGEFDSDGVDWSHIFFGVYLSDSRGKELRTVVGKLQHLERVRKNW